MTDATTDTSGPALAADGTPLKKQLAQAMFRSKMRAVGLVTPLLILITLAFLVPLVVFLTQGVYNPTFAENMKNVSPLLATWDTKTAPTEDMYAALAADLVVARKDKSIGRVASRVNRELSGTRSLFTKTARKAKKLDPPYKDALIGVSNKWADIQVWGAMKIAAKSLTPAYLASALDMKYNADGSFERKPANQRIYMTLLVRTLKISVFVTIMGFILGYPIAYLLSTLSTRTSNLLLILVLLPFWTSLLVRTTAWIAILQAHGALNDLFVFFGLTSDDQRFSMIYNETGTLIAMTHILLPFMVLPLYSVMKTIPPTYVRAAKSMGATDWTAFWRVYFPQSIPGIGAGGILVFILAISFYITPALVGGESGTMISNMIDFHMRKSLNWSLAAALGMVLLTIVLFIYYLYDKIVGIDNMKLG